MNHLGAMRRDYLDFVMRLQSQHPDIAHVRIPNEHVTHVFHPDWVRQILVEQSDALIRWERATEVFSLSMGQSVLVTEGEQWQRQRRMLQPGFTPRRVAGYAALMAQAARDAVDGLLTQQNTTIDMDALMTRVTLDVILRTLFGQHEIADAMPIARAIQTLSHYGFTQLFKPFSWPLWMPLKAEWQTRQALNTLNRLISHHIDAQANKPTAESTDLLSMLRLARDPDHPDQSLSAQELHDQISAIFQAGHETTATALTWWCGLIARHPETAQRIYQEIDTVLQGQAPTPETLVQMPWLQASIKETLRLYPPAALLFTRRACQNIAVGPWTIPKGELIAFTPYVIQRDPRWFDAPEAFRPERFLPDAPDVRRGAWIPFGTGPRVCIGQHFAMLEMGVIAAMLLQRVALSWPENQTWPQGNLAVSLRPDRPMKLNLKARR